MISKSLHCSSITRLQDEIRLILQSGFQPTLAVVFCSGKHDLEKINAVFTEKGIDVAGCTTAGEIANDQLLEDAIAVLLMDIDRSYYSIKYQPYDMEDVYHSAVDVGVFATRQYARPGLILFSGGISVDAVRMLEGIKEGLGRKTPVYGGLAGDDLQMKRTRAFYNGEVTDAGMVAIVIDTDKIEITGMVACGWKALGGVHIITRAEGNVLYSINDQPALDVFLRHFGVVENPTTKKELLMSIQTNYPLQIIRPDGTCVLRTPLMIDEQKRTMTLAGGVQTGDRFRFSNSPGFEVIEETVKAFGKLKNASPQADALLLFSCIGRHGAFGPVLEEEIEGLYRYWKKPMIGFLSYGEIGHTKNGTCEFHNETCSLMILREK